MNYPVGIDQGLNDLLFQFWQRDTFFLESSEDGRVALLVPF